MTVPQAELHCHIEGAAPPDLVRRLAIRHGLDLRGLFQPDGSYLWTDFTTFLAAYDLASSVFRTPEDYADLAEAYLVRSAGQGLIYSEIFISPDHARASGLSYPDYVQGLATGIERATARTGIEARMIAVGVRHLGADAVQGAAKEAVRHPHPLVVGFGLAGDERQGRAEDFSHAFALAGEAGLGLTAHAGEFGGAESVRDVLDHLAVSRIGHGVRAEEDPRLVNRLADEGIVLEVCPGSNVSLGLYDSYAAHPIARLRDAGVLVTINSDDPPFFHTTVAEEYDRTAEAQKWTRTDLREITRVAIEAAFCDETTRQTLRNRLSASNV